MNSYDIGDLVRITGAFVNITNVPTDPTAVILRLLSPLGSSSILNYPHTPTEVSKASVGSYYYDLLITEKGIWRYRWEGTGAVQTAGENQLSVRRQLVP